VQTPYEPTTGSDFDLVFLDLTKNTIVQFRIQSKRLTAHSKWWVSSYKELAHPHGTGLQVKTLIDPANLKGSIPTVPLYAFYNPGGVCGLAGVEGIALADAFEIEKIIDELIAAKPNRPKLKRISHLKSYFFSLTDIMCAPGGSKGRNFINPEEAVRGYAIAVNRRRNMWGDFQDPDIPKVGRDIPSDIRSLFSSGAERKLSEAKLKRPRILIAADTDG